MRVLITGCSTGIGRAAAQVLTARGHEVVATARKPESLADLDVAAKLALDVDSDASVAAALSEAGELDALVNNAGANVAGGPIEKVPLDAARRLFETNFFGAVRMIQAVVPGLRERGRGGSIVNVSSVSGRVGGPLGGFYSASKFALEGLSETLQLELGHFGIRVALVEPGFIATPFRDNSSHFGEEDPPYDELARQWNGTDGVLLGGQSRPGPELVGAIIADAVEGADAKLRWPAGADAEMVLGARAKMGDEEFIASMRQLLGVEW